MENKLKEDLKDIGENISEFIGNIFMYFFLIALIIGIILLSLAYPIIGLLAVGLIIFLFIIW